MAAGSKNKQKNRSYISFQASIFLQFL